MIKCVYFSKRVYIKTLIFHFIIVLLIKNSNALESSYFQGKQGLSPYREQAVILSKDGYFPDKFTFFKGEKIHFFLSTVELDSACFNVPEKNLFASVVSKKINEVEIIFDNAGTFEINCPHFLHKGKIIVLDNKSKESDFKKRMPASVMKIWKPKDLPSEWIEIKKEDFSKYKEFDDVINLDEENEE